ncbi:MAG: hypothetical protein ABIV13_00270 [Fimbriimonadales bacterium]
MAELTTKQKWSQFALGLGIALAVGLVLHLLGARAAFAAIPAVGMWIDPWIELRTTGRQPKNLVTRQCAALGLTIGYVIFELTRWA